MTVQIFGVTNGHIKLRPLTLLLNVGRRLIYQALVAIISIFKMATLKTAIFTAQSRRKNHQNRRCILFTFLRVSE